LSISLGKHSLSLALERWSVRSKLLTKLLHRSTLAFDRSITHKVAIGTNPDCRTRFDGIDCRCSDKSRVRGLADSNLLLKALI
jgi:hypothetical protein